MQFRQHRQLISSRLHQSNPILRSAAITPGQSRYESMAYIPHFPPSPSAQSSRSSRGMVNPRMLQFCLSPIFSANGPPTWVRRRWPQFRVRGAANLYDLHPEQQPVVSRERLSAPPPPQLAHTWADHRDLSLFWARVSVRELRLEVSVCAFFAASSSSSFLSSFLPSWPSANSRERARCWPTADSKASLWRRTFKSPHSTNKQTNKQINKLSHTNMPYLCDDGVGLTWNLCG